MAARASLLATVTRPFIGPAPSAHEQEIALASILTTRRHSVKLRAPICPGMRLLDDADGSCPARSDPACGGACLRGSRATVEVMAWTTPGSRGPSTRAHLHASPSGEDGDRDRACPRRALSPYREAADDAPARSRPRPSSHGRRAFGVRVPSWRQAHPPPFGNGMRGTARRRSP